MGIQLTQNETPNPRNKPNINKTTNYAKNTIPIRAEKQPNVQHKKAPTNAKQTTVTNHKVHRSIKYKQMQQQLSKQTSNTKPIQTKQTKSRKQMEPATNKQNHK